MSIIDDLLEYDQQTKAATQPSVIFAVERGTYLSGIPYLWTCFAERAFVFATPEDAQHFIDAHPEDFNLEKIGLVQVLQRSPQ